MGRAALSRDGRGVLEAFGERNITAADIQNRNVFLGALRH
jgi:hypothetical protein